MAAPPEVTACDHRGTRCRANSPVTRRPAPAAKPRRTRPVSLIQLLSSDSLRKKPIPSTKVTAPMMASQFRPKDLLPINPLQECERVRGRLPREGWSGVGDSRALPHLRAGRGGGGRIARWRAGLSRSGGLANTCRASSASGAAGSDGTASVGAAGAGVASDSCSERTGASPAGSSADGVDGAGPKTAARVSSTLSSSARRACSRSSRCEICSSWLSTAPS